MNASEQRVTARVANDHEHEAIEKQLMSVAKGYVLAKRIVLGMAVTMIVLYFIEMMSKGVNGKDTIAIIAMVLIFILYCFLFKKLCIPYYRIPKREYVILDCIVTDLRVQHGSRGQVSYWAMVSYADGTTQEVEAAKREIAEKIELGGPGVVVFFPEKDGKLGKHAFSLCIV